MEVIRHHQNRIPRPHVFFTPGIRRLDEYRDLLPLHALAPQRYPFLLESVTHNTSQARYDILFAFPQENLVLKNLNDLFGNGLDLSGNNFLSNLDAWWNQLTTKSEISLPFYGGWFLYLGYELAAQIEPSLNLPDIDLSCNLPTACAIRIPVAIIRDHVERCTYLVAEYGHEHKFETILDDLMQSDVKFVPSDKLKYTVNEDDPDEFLSRVKKIKRYIVDGDVFQVNLSRQWRVNANSEIDYKSLYDNLRRYNPAPFAGLAYLGNNKTVISSSPERLVKIRNGMVETRPIAGTRPRGVDEYADSTLKCKLINNPKERAEHIMLIDLERNDLGRVCIPGSIEVNELMGLESYQHVHHIVSNIRGKLDPLATPGKVIRSIFPGGTITGCPKVRCMEIIAELEQVSRGAYTGAMGYLNRDGNMDLSILIRTMVQDENQVKLRTGAGIVADSNPERELDETRDKALGLLNTFVKGKIRSGIFR